MQPSCNKEDNDAMKVTGIEELRKKLLNVKEKQAIYLKATLGVHAKMTERIFQESGTADSKNIKIGTYSDSYLRLRKKAGHTGNPNIRLYGVIKTTPSGTPRGKNKYRTSGQMKEDWKAGVIKEGNRVMYGNGFDNLLNFNKSTWVEDTYKRKIFVPTLSEEDLFVNIIEKNIDL